MKREISHAHEYILMRAKIPAGRERILLVDKIIYLVVEFILVGQEEFLMRADRQSDATRRNSHADEKKFSCG